MLVTYIEAIRQAMDEELSRDRNVLLMGEDVGVLGGAFKASAGSRRSTAPTGWSTCPSPSR